MKHTDWSWECSDSCLRMSAKSWEGSNNQSTAIADQPHQIKALERGALGPAIKSAMHGGELSVSPSEGSPPSPGSRQGLLAFRQVLAPCPGEPHTLSFFVTIPQRCCPWAQPVLLLHCPCWNAWQSLVPSFITLATDRPLMGFPSVNWLTAWDLAGDPPPQRCRRYLRPRRSSR